MYKRQLLQYNDTYSRAAALSPSIWVAPDKLSGLVGRAKMCIRDRAVVLGKDAKDVPAGQTKDYEFGYTILNDVSARDVQTAHKQWSVSYTHLDV